MDDITKSAQAGDANASKQLHAGATWVWAMFWSLVAWGLCFWGLAIFAAQCLHWLKYGVWIDIKAISLAAEHVSSGAQEPVALMLVPQGIQGPLSHMLNNMNWTGLQELLVRFLEVMPFSMFMLILAALAFGLKGKTKPLSSIGRRAATKPISREVHV